MDRAFKPGEFDAIVTNPPWGVRVGKDADLEKVCLWYKFLLIGRRTCSESVNLSEYFHYMDAVREVDQCHESK